MSYGVADRIKRFREAPAATREERSSREYDTGSGNKPRMWWEETNEPTLRYDNDILGQSSSPGNSVNYDNNRRVIRSKGQSNEKERLGGSLDASLDVSLDASLELSAMPLGISTIPLPYHH